MLFKKKKSQKSEQDKSPTEIVKATLDDLEEAIQQKRELLSSAQKLTKRVVECIPQRRKLSA